MYYYEIYVENGKYLYTYKSKEKSLNIKDSQSTGSINRN